MWTSWKFNVKSPKQDKLNYLSATLSKNRVADLIKSQTFSAEELLDYTFHPEHTISFRSAWLLEFMANTSPTTFVSIFDAFIHSFPKQKNLSAQRHFSRIMILIQEEKAPLLYKEQIAKLEIDQKETLVSTLFDWLIRSDTPVAVKANCMEALVYFCYDFDWIAEEMNHQLDLLMDLGSPALTGRGKIVRKKLAKFEKYRKI